LYPLIGIRAADGNIDFCLTTAPDAILKDYPGFEFHGAFRSRRITGDAFFALMRLLRFVGHVNPSKSRNRIPRYSYIFSFRRLPSTWSGVWASFYKGESGLAMEELILKLTENAGARRQSIKVQEHLDDLKRFWRHEVLRLAKVRKATACEEWPVAQYQRDLIFLSYSAGALAPNLLSGVVSSVEIQSRRHAPLSQGGSAIEDGASGGSKAAIFKVW
jgi:excinuclease ABC subunit C